IKSAKTGLADYVDRIVDAFEVGYLKMRSEYWPNCRKLVGFDPSHSLYIDDDESCLAAAKQYGIKEIIHSARSSSQLPPVCSTNFTSVDHLPVLLTGRRAVRVALQSSASFSRSTGQSANEYSQEEI